MLGDQSQSQLCKHWIWRFAEPASVGTDHDMFALQGIAPSHTLCTLQAKVNIGSQHADGEAVAIVRLNRFERLSVRVKVMAPRRRLQPFQECCVATAV
jgi:hypothetical protein